MKINIYITVYLIIIACCSLLTIGCNNFSNKTANVEPLDNSYTITGKITGLKDGYAFIRYSDSNRIVIDTAIVKDEAFVYTGKVKDVEPFWLGFNDVVDGVVQPSIIFKNSHILSPGSLSIVGNLDSLDYLKFRGTPAHDEFNDYVERVKKLNLSFNEITGELYVTSRENKARLDSLNKQYKNVSNEIAEVIGEFVSDYPNSKVAAFVTYLQLKNTPVELLDEIYGTFSQSVKESVYGVKLAILIKKAKDTNMGVKAPSFTLPNAEGKSISLESAMGKYTLIDFWASWCGPCRAENPNLISAYNKYKDKGFKIIGISVDTNKESWLKAVKDDKLPWLQLSDLKALKSEVVMKYGITTVPMNFLLDAEGKIIARNLKGVELMDRLESIF